MPRLRTRRATVEDIYRSCRPTNTCSADVINAVEQNTLADRFLKWISSFLYFGNLGISTGSGGGGRLGYTPLVPSRPAVSTSAARPPVVTDTIGALDILGPTPGQIDAASPSIVPLTDGTASGTLDIETIAEIQPPPPPHGGAGLGGFAETEGAVLPSSDPPIQPAISHTQFNNPAFEVTNSTPDNIGEISTGDHVIVSHEGSGQSVGEAPSIPLHDLQPSSTSFDTDIIMETDFGGRTSTPAADPTVRGDRAVLYGRRVAQRPLTDPTFLNRPQDLAIFDNPAFDPEESFDLPKAPDTVEAAPHSDFTDVVHIGRPRYGLSQDGHVRLSRLGTQAGVRTRSNTILTGQTHFYLDISTLTEALELPTLGEHAGLSSSLDPLLTESSFTIHDTASPFEIIDLDPSSTQYTEDDLLDIFPDIGDRLQLRFTRPRQPTSTTVPNLTGAFGDSVVNTGSGIYLHIPEDHSTPRIPTIIDWTSIMFPQASHISSFDFLLHPSALRLRRKRKRSVHDDDGTIIE
ncbi:L2 [Trichechus manatus latirostris papillomavirus 4]|uniref:Minor capsid protein L2 n=1 Tax=Trichechus manatus latirostris papillomavirus 4 TaxID=2848317 RepID=A0A0F6RAR8_9PAPI|nr:L2 [Trichechus manatus latirostris papillomavirus 4]AKE50906.1 L2 [Trichechus manatus latirostris papillomavirus 4]